MPETSALSTGAEQVDGSVPSQLKELWVCMSSVDQPLARDEHLRVARRTPDVVDPFRRTGGDVLVERNVMLDQGLLHRC
eukprot:COSAG02_NODE_4326_length_5498_cov_2.417299_9_plen_78_part_01